jgi:hypothetical protein
LRADVGSISQQLKSSLEGISLCCNSKSPARFCYAPAARVCLFQFRHNPLTLLRLPLPPLPQKALWLPTVRTFIEEVRRELREQQEELRRMRAVITEQTQVIEALRQRVDGTASEQNASRILKTSDMPVSDNAPQTAPQKAQAGEMDARLARIEEQAKKTSEALSKQLGSISFIGDLRLQYESFYRQLNALTNGDNPAILGNELSTRLNRLIFSYTADPRVVFSFIGIVNQRPHGPLGAFGTTPTGSLNRPTTRLQFDTTFRF